MHTYRYVLEYYQWFRGTCTRSFMTPPCRHARRHTDTPHVHALPACSSTPKHPVEPSQHKTTRTVGEKAPKRPTAAHSKHRRRCAPSLSPHKQISTATNRFHLSPKAETTAQHKRGPQNGFGQHNERRAVNTLENKLVGATCICAHQPGLSRRYQHPAVMSHSAHQPVHRPPHEQPS